MATATAATEVQTKFEIIPVAKITPSPMNPRKHFDEKALKELAESIKAHGVLEPILVRPRQVLSGMGMRPAGSKPFPARTDGFVADAPFMLVVGERRYRACKLAGVDGIPAIIRELSDAAALEIMVIENLQREDVHPLDEALGYEALMKKASETDPELGELPGAPRHTAESIAAKVGKSVGYVYARLKLLALVPAAREAFEQEYITAGHAVLLARLQPKDQLQGLQACFKHYVTTYDHDRVNKLDAKAAKFADIVEMPEERNIPLLPEKGLREWIQEHVNLSLKSVPWDLADEKLLPEAGACGSCLKRSVSNPSLFLGLTNANEHDTCFDPACFQAKQKAFVKLQVKAAKTSDAPLVQISEQTAYTKPKEGEKILKRGQWLPAKKGECEGVTKALIVRGENAGEQQLVCADLNCKVHKRHLSSGGTSFRSDEPKRDEAAEKRALEDQHKFKLLLFEKVRAKLDGPSRAVLQSIFEEIMESGGIWAYKAIVEHYGWKGGPEKVLSQKIATLPIKKAWNLLIEMILFAEVEERYEELGKHLPTLAKAYKIDIAKLSKQFKSQTSEKPLAKKAKAGK